MEKTWDVVIIGAGVVGACVARELARWDLDVIVLEAGNDIACRTSRANSGIVHAGYDPKPGTNKARFNVAGARLMPQWAAELGFGYRQNGSMVVAFAAEERKTLEELLVRGRENGVEGLEIVDGDEARRREPHLSPEVVAALVVPTGGICDPFGLAFGAMENAVTNGVKLEFGKLVRTITPAAATVNGTDASAPDADGGRTSGRPDAASDPSASHISDAKAAPEPADGGLEGSLWSLTCDDGSTYRTRAVVNAAGVWADELNNQVSAERLEIIPTRGEYCLYHADLGTLFDSTIFQVPGPAGKGVLVSPTVHGNLFVGPNSVPQESKTDVSTTREGLDYIISQARRSWPEASGRNIITNFAGLRARGKNGDFVIGEAPDAPGFFNAACIESPGLTAAPAIGTHLAAAVAEKLAASPRADFNPERHGSLPFVMSTEEQRAAATAENPARGHIVCRCCQVTEAELVDALHSPIPVLSLDSLKWRTGATMGPCHGGFCTPEILRIVARELGVAPEDVQKRLVGSPLLASAREDFVELCQAETDTPQKVATDDGAAATTAAVEDGGTAKPATATTNSNAPVPSDLLVETSENATSPAAQMSPAAATGAASTSGEDPFYPVVVVGAGAAGLAAVRAARDAGAERVLIIDREAHPGGILRQCIHNGFGLHRFRETLTGPEYAAKEADCLGLFGVNATWLTTVLSIDPLDDGTFSLVLCSSKRVSRVRAGGVVLATGSRERGLGALNLAGSRPAGIFTAGCAQNLINLQGCIPGRRAVVLGSGDIGLIMARRMTLSGMEVEGVYEIAPEPSGLKRNIVQCLDDFGIPLHLSTTAVRIEGDGRLEAVWVSDYDAKWQPIPGTERRIPCDTLVLSVGLVPENELAKTAGVALDPVTGGPRVDDSLMTNVPGIFSCGNSLHVHDLADNASDEGDRAGAQAAIWAKAATRRNAHATAAMQASFAPATDIDVEPVGSVAAAVVGEEATHVPVIPGEGVRYVVPQQVTCGAGQPTTLSMRVRATRRNVRVVVIGEVAGEQRVIRSSRKKIVLPSEMIHVKADLTPLGGMYDSITVEIQEA